MKKLLIVLLFLVFVSPAVALDLITYDKVESTTGVSFDMESTGGWDAVTVPSTVEYIRHIAIQVNDGSGSVSDTTAAFLLSFDSNGAEYWYVPETGIGLSMGKQAGEVIGYVKTAASGQDITVIGLK